jgi:predicted nuclease of predicted toxin-antitoxin system
VAAKLKTDENLPESAAALLRAGGHDVMTALEEGLGGVGDERVAKLCRSEERALVTLDRGLGDIRTYPPADHYGIVILHPRAQGIDAILALIRHLLSLFDAEPLIGALWIVDEHRVRIRR